MKPTIDVEKKQVYGLQNTFATFFILNSKNSQND